MICSIELYESDGIVDLLVDLGFNFIHNAYQLADAETKTLVVDGEAVASFTWQQKDRLIMVNKETQLIASQSGLSFIIEGNWATFSFI